MTTIEASAQLVPSSPAVTADVEIVVPVYNEERDLAHSVRRLHAYLRDDFPFPTMITIADNASTDGTWLIAQQLARELADVRAVHLAAKGRGRALHDVWAASNARIVAYMDVDLSTDLAALLPLIAPLDVGAQRRGDRHPAVPDGPRGSRPAAGAHLPRVQPPAARDAAGPLLRRAVRIQGDARRLRTRSAAATSRTGAGSSTPSCSCWPSGPGCASTRFRSTGSTTRTAGSTSSLPQWRTCAASSGSVARSPAEPCPCVICGSSSVGNRSGYPGVPPTLAGQILRFAAVGAVSTLAYLLLFVLLRGGSARSWPIWSRCSSRPSPTPPPTDDSPSACAGEGVAATSGARTCRVRARPRP